MTIIFTGGVSGGHIFPIVAICRQIKKNSSVRDIKLYYIGPKERYAAGLLEKEGVKIKTVLTGKIRRYFSFRNFLDLFKIPIGLIQSFFWLFFLSPDIVFSKGGSGSFPVSLMAKFLGIPLFLHESDSVPGMVSKIESKWATEIFVSFLDKEAFPTEKIICLGNPVREETLKGSKERAKEMFNLRGDKPLILILGGSQGSQRINEVILEILPEMLKSFELIHQTGKNNFRSVKLESEGILSSPEIKKYYHIFPFLKENYYKNALVAADLVVSRAGSGSIFEIAAAAKPAILIPLAGAAQEHQLKNAYNFAESGGGEVIEEKNLRPHFLLEKLKHLSLRTDILESMAEGSRSFARPRAAEIIASYLIGYLKALK